MKQKRALRQGGQIVKKQNKKQNFDYIKATFSVMVLLLAVSTTWLGVALHKKSVISGSIPSGIHVNLGVMDYAFTGNRAVKHVDASDRALLAVLTKAAQKDINLGCRASFYTVKAFNADRTQVRLGFGCNEPTSPMFAIETGGNWQLLSPTNHFDTFGNPDCSYAAHYDIDRLVAPVCVSDWYQSSGMPQYTVRQ
jgi:hypothetical protein